MTIGLIEKMRKQTAIYWAPEKPDQYGKPTFADPVEITCRWVDKQQEVMTSLGQTIVSTSVVYVSEDVIANGRMMLGSLDSTTPSDPYETTTFEIKMFTKNPTFRGDEFLRTAFMG